MKGGKGRDAWRAFTVTRAPTRRFAVPLKATASTTPLFSAGDEARASGDDEVSVLSLKGGDATCRPGSPPPSLGLDWVRRMKLHIAPDKTIIWGARLGRIFCVGATMRRFGGQWRCSNLIFIYYF
jgi:hypothetical protein